MTDNTLPNFFKTIESQSTKGQINVLNAMTGSGKTHEVLKHIASVRNNQDTKIVLACSSIQEIMECILRLKRIIQATGARTDSVNRCIKETIGLHFNFNQKKNKSVIAELLKSKAWDVHEKAFILSLATYTPSKAFTNKIVFTTHQNLGMRAGLYSEYCVIIDEVTNYTFDLVQTKKSASALKEAHLNTLEFSGEKHLDPNWLSRMVGEGLVTVSSFAEGSVAYHLNDNHPFKSLTVMTAFAEATGLGVLKDMGFNVKFFITDESLVKVEAAKELMTIEALPNTFTTNTDTAKVVTELKGVMNRPQSSFTINTASQAGEVTTVAIRTNKTGINSLADLDEVLVATQLNMDNATLTAFKRRFGIVEGAKWEMKIAGAKLLQSIYRGCIRKGEAMRVVCCSQECKNRVELVLSKYLKQ